MACALVSLIAGVPVRHDVAMTGELTLRGKVLPIGGLKEKLLAAARAGITTAIIPAGNAPELTEIPPHVTSRLTVRPVRTMDEVLEIALAQPLVSATVVSGTQAKKPSAIVNGDGQKPGPADDKPRRAPRERRKTARPGIA
jgi:ATP-dependent Lon protease